MLNLSVTKVFQGPRRQSIGRVLLKKDTNMAIFHSSITSDSQGGIDLLAQKATLNPRLFGET